MKLEELFSERKREGISIGVANSIITVLSIKGNVTEEMKDKIESQTDIEVLNEWLAKATVAATVEEFDKEISVNELV